MPEAAAAPVAEEVFGPELFSELLGGGGGGGVASVEAAAPGTIAKGLTDAQVAGSAFAPAAGAAAGAAASAAGGGAPGAEVGGAAGAAPAGGFVGDLPLDAGAGAGGGGFVGDLPVDPSAGAAQTPINQLVPAASTSGAPGASGLPSGGADTAGFGPPAVADTLPGSPEDPLRKAVDTATGSTTTAPASGAGVSAALQKLGIWGPEGLGKNALPLGILGGSQALAANSRNALAKQLQAAGAGPKAASERLLGQGASGDVPPSIMAQFDRSLAAKREEIAQRYANMGRDAKTDSGAQFEMQRAQDARDAQVAQYASQLTSQGLQAASIAAGPTTNAALAAAQQDKDLAASMGNTLSTLAMLEAMNGRKASVP